MASTRQLYQGMVNHGARLVNAQLMPAVSAQLAFRRLGNDIRNLSAAKNSTSSRVIELNNDDSAQPSGSLHCVREVLFNERLSDHREATASRLAAG
jgi:hypothetical protein